MRVDLVFGTSERDKTFYRLLVQTYIAGAQLRDTDRNIANIRMTSRVLRGLRYVAGSDPKLEAERAKADNPSVFRGISQVLNPDGGTIVMEQADVKILMDWAERIPWLPHQADEVEDFYDWLSKAPEHKQDAG